MRSTALALTLAIGGCLAEPAAAQNPSAGDLINHATGFKDQRGHAIAKLFVPGDNVLGPGRWRFAASIEGQSANFHVPALPGGRYAVVVFHDQNDSGTIAHGLFGPSEPIGFSGGFALSLTSGRPTFEKLQFEFTPPKQTLEVSMR